MTLGCRRGRCARTCLPLGLFVDERGYTSIAVACALLVSVTLVFCVATAEWTSSRAAEVQDVADAAALAGTNVVASYCTIAHVVDAVILSLGLTGMIVLGAGLVTAAIPGAQELSSKTLDVGKRIIDARNSFAKTAVSGLREVEGLLPYIVVCNSWSCVQANACDGLSYAGAALPFPLASQSDFSSLETELDGEGLSDATERLQDATKEVEEQKERADAARERAWRADCVDDPRCMRSRARDLAALPDAENPDASCPEEWDFGMALSRSRSYYAERLAEEAPQADDIESVTDSLARGAFYEYALDELNHAWYHEHSDGSVDLYLPHLARNTREVQQTYLYTDAVWPCTQEEAGTTLHSTLACPGAHGPDAGTASVAQVDAGEVLRCEECCMDASDLGAVASISTTATNGYEHYWQIVVDQSQAYQQARNDQADAERRAKEVAEEGSTVFEHALEALRVPRPHICPSGAWGCVSVVARKEGAAPSPRLTQAFVSDVRLPAGVAASAAALAPDDNVAGNDVLTHLFDGMLGGQAHGSWTALGGVAGLWGRLLTSYGTAYEQAGSATGGFLDRIDGVFGRTTGAWLKRRVTQIVESLGLEPADMRMRKPVLTNTGNVLQRAGFDKDAELRRLVESLPATGSASEVARAFGIAIAGDPTRRLFTMGSFSVPGTDMSIPVTLDLSYGGDTQ